jgi:hypothetical protein
LVDQFGLRVCRHHRFLLAAGFKARQLLFQNS